MERRRIINGGASFRIIGTDGGLIEAPVDVTEVLLPAADRVDILVGPFAEGTRLAIDSLRYNRTTMKKRSNEQFGTLIVGPEKPSRAAIPERLRTIEPLADADGTPNRTVQFSVGMSLRRGLDFLINGERHHHDRPVKVGELQVWDVLNASLMDHPFHLHGFFFQVLSINGEAPRFRSWEDVLRSRPLNQCFFLPQEHSRQP